MTQNKVEFEKNHPILPSSLLFFSFFFFHFERYRTRSIKKAVGKYKFSSLLLFLSSLVSSSLSFCFPRPKTRITTDFAERPFSAQLFSFFFFFSLSLFFPFTIAAVNFLNEGTFGNIICLLFVRSRFNCRRTIVRLQLEAGSTQGGLGRGFY